MKIYTYNVNCNGFLSRDQHSRDQLPPDQLSQDQLATRSDQINSIFLMFTNDYFQHLALNKMFLILLKYFDQHTSNLKEGKVFWICEFVTRLGAWSYICW